MFKKGVSIAQTRPLSGKDVKQLKKDVSLNFPDLSESDISNLIPSKAEVSLVKLSNRTQAYTCNGSTPLFFDPEGRGDLLVPTVYALWQCPHILPHLLTYSEVSPKVLGGADLFLQGIIVPQEGLGSFSVGDLRVIKIPDNPYPFAVGLLEVSSEDVARKGLTGRGLKLLHHYPDLLYGLGSKATPSDSFTPTRIFPQAAGTPSTPTQTPSPGEPSASDPTDTSAQLDTLTLNKTQSHTNGHHAPDASESGSAAFRQLLTAESAEPDDPDPGQDVSNLDENASSQQESLPSDPDSVMQRALVARLASVQDSELPLLCSNFWSRHILQGRPAGAELDLKKTSYKKLPKLLSTFEKKGLLQVKLIHKQDNLASINRSHPLLEHHVASAPAAEPKAAARQEPAASSSTTTVTYEYRVPSSLRAIFVDGAAPETLYTTEQVREALHGYAAAQGLQGADKAAIVLDRLMASNLYNKKEPESEGDIVDAERLLQRLLAKLLRFNCVTRQTPEGAKRTVQKGELKPIVVSMEDRQGGRKHITRIAFFEPFGLDPDELAAVLQRKFQTNASVTKLPGKTETAKEIALQGNLLRDIPRLLLSEFGIEPSFVDVKSKGK